MASYLPIIIILGGKLAGGKSQLPLVATFGRKWPALPPFENRASLRREFVAAPNLMPFALVVATPIQRLASRALLLIKND